MEKRYINMALIYAIGAMAFGVFYREFTKFSGFVGQTSLSLLHTHYFMLGMMVFLVLLFAQKLYSFSDEKTGQWIILYQIGLNITGLSFLMRGLTQVSGMELSKAMNASISGIAGIGHILVAVTLVVLLLKIRKKVSA